VLGDELLLRGGGQLGVVSRAAAAAASLYNHLHSCTCRLPGHGARLLGFVDFCAFRWCTACCCSVAHMVATDHRTSASVHSNPARMHPFNPLPAAGSTRITTRRLPATWSIWLAWTSSSTSDGPSAPSTSSWECCPQPASTHCHSASSELLLRFMGMMVVLDNSTISAPLFHGSSRWSFRL
jgi:hypothetical protein